MTNPMWPNVDRSQYLKERWVAERQRAGAVKNLARSGNRLAALVMLSYHQS